jgi:hypothetical protein
MGMEEDPDPKNREAVVANIFIAVAIYGVRPPHPHQPTILSTPGVKAGPVTKVVLLTSFRGNHTGLLCVLRITGISTRASKPEGSDFIAMSVGRGRERIGHG